MATATTPPPRPALPQPATQATVRPRVGPAHHGRALTLAAFEQADFEDGWRYELARGVVIVTDVPGITHARVVARLADLFMMFARAHPGVVNFRGGGGECRLLLPGVQSERHPDQAIYLTAPPTGEQPWPHWTPDLVVEVDSRSSDDRDYVEKREEYLRGGVREYWIVDPHRARLLVLTRLGDAWEEAEVSGEVVHRPSLLPGLEVRLADLLGRAEGPEPA